MDKLVGFGIFNIMMVGVDVGFIVLIIEFVEEFTERVFDFLGGGFKVEAGELFNEFRDVVSGASEGGVGEVVNPVAEGVAVDFFVNGEGTALLIVM